MGNFTKPSMAPRVILLSQSVMLATLWLISLSFSILWAHSSISCSYKSLCRRALLSGNNIVLRCDHPGALWYFTSILGKAVFLISSIHNTKNLPGGSLLLVNPQPSQSGLYSCQDNHNTLTVEYEIDFQDVTTLHITHKTLDQQPLQNETLMLGGEVLIFTQWEPWQDCNLCGVPGERKRLGYCYIEEPGEKPMPCGLYMGEEKLAHSRLRPELQVEACLVPYNPAKETDQPYFIFDIYQLGKLTDSMWLTCPLASIYRPISWEANKIPLTWQNELSGKSYNSTLNLATGGQQLQIFQPAIYRCFVEQELVAQFNPMATLELLAPPKRENKTQALPRKADLVPLKLKLVLLMGIALALGLLLFNTLCSAPGKSRKQMLLAK
ncbi:protein FAM187B isoform X1 [Fukomys damarensis]|uniref:protein FAM187B isoform X1 n=1 Tax=Fukomys damarensis TaxID=885580 RepID=UPI0005400C4B|nr:protein FAM187B isoform X1 [Fukomys damarensis]XP_010624636.1 protein FAM187B isoform X1 [Fukomys damarensis]XP_019063321.1 protein FAM187B isoform X1 [Fukomys damarensis]